MGKWRHEAEEIIQKVLHGSANMDETNVEQLEVFLEAYEIFLDRNEQYGDLWKEYGEDIKLHIRSKLLRLDKMGREDDALDLLNYTVFWLRLKREGVL